jgi:hypothetical protein
MKFDMQKMKYAIGLFLFVTLCQISVLHATSLSDAVNTVKQMLGQGKSKAEIANYVNQVVDNRIIALNRDTNDESRLLDSQQYDMIKETFDAWSHEGVGVDDPYAAAHWVWQNRAGHCQEHAHTSYHILMMALESGEEIGEFACGDHVYVIWGIPKGFTGEITIDVLNSWGDAYIIDPWLDVCKPTSDIGRLDLTLTKAGFYDINRVATWSYSSYQRKYDKWLNSCEDFKGKYGATSDKLIVTEVNGKSNIQVGQTMKMMPAGVFQVMQNKNEVTIVFRGSELNGMAIGRLAILNDVVKGNTIYANLTKVKIGGKVKLKVVMEIKHPSTGAVVTREGILSKVQ